MSIQVAVRVRPALQRELNGKSFNSCVGVRSKTSDIYVTTSDKPILVNANEKNTIASNAAHLQQFHFTHVFPTTASTSIIYNTLCKSAVLIKPRRRCSTWIPKGGLRPKHT